MKVKNSLMSKLASIVAIVMDRHHLGEDLRLLVNDRNLFKIKRFFYSISMLFCNISDEKDNSIDIG